jgi:NADH-ubiquinone oxidoreductase chain 3
MNNLFFLFIFVPILAFILLALNVLLAPHKPDESKVSAYECGFSPVYLVKLDLLSKFILY